jgi:hypothetical protein
MVNDAAALLKPKLRSSKHSQTGMTRGRDEEGLYDEDGVSCMVALDFMVCSQKLACIEM